MNETATRILPCPSYDIEAVESWLTDQAKQGGAWSDRETTSAGSTFGRTCPGHCPTGWYPL